MEHRGSCCCNRECPNCYDYTRLCYIILRLLRLFCRLYKLFHNQKAAFGVGIHCRLLANCIIHNGRTVFVASSSGIDSISNHQSVFSLNNADIRCTFRCVHTMDVCKPTGTHSRTKLITQVIKALGYGFPLVRPHVVRQSKFLTNL